jgi:hypothetical protein
MGGKSTLGECFEAWLEGKEMSQELLPIVFVKVKVNAIMSVDVVEGVFKADFVGMAGEYDVYAASRSCSFLCSHVRLV